ncbi:Gamma-glutamyl-hercynylcysteine sulfoxide hydrolase [Nocardia farcinica]|uniref:ergothioneine biosynthesis protein EgtC n=1 Tax=Nocardia farcinica TaxID=37329 RepID=UPI000BF930CD|nr:ergothioneine biosynthesis protein EgtC [Nocardia farcinica]PFX01163.1 Gamma-glutamyl-hercynylcysteine sulfoxide hydrolase [Nocardia farcinica]PFX07567.1 Gamma-glutamyl-hercynylcysteine sulfoxide hydrolase [Nocardia farcinica]
MCRHLGYVGAPVAVGELLTRGTHSLREQSWAPREMRGGGTINADGFGAAWWRPATDGVAVSRYRNREPIWSDPAVTEVLGQLVSPAVLGSVRSATVGMPVERSACAPFTTGRWAFSHNGVVPRWRQVLSAVSADLDVAATRSGATRLFETARLLDAEAATDAATLWVLLADLIASAESGGYGDDPETAVRLLVEAVLRHEPAARLNFLLCDGTRLLATTIYHSLSALVTDEFAILSSEPYDDDPRWQPIPDHCLVRAEPGRLAVEPLTGVPAAHTERPLA